MLFQLPLFPLTQGPIVPEQLELGRAFATIRASTRDRVCLLWGSSQGISLCFAERMLVIELQTANGIRQMNSATWHQSGRRTKTFDLELAGKPASDTIAAFLSAFVAGRDPENPRNVREITYSRETLLWTVRENERFVDYTFGVVCARGEYQKGKVTAPLLEDPGYRSLDLTTETHVLRITDPSTVTL